MADATVNSVADVDGVLHIYGTGFTQTTTIVYVDDVTTEHGYVSATELTIDPIPAVGASIVVEKGGVQTAPQLVPGEAPAEAPPEETSEAPPVQAATALDNLSSDIESAQKSYPYGNPPDPELEFEKIHGFKRVIP